MSQVNEKDLTAEINDLRERHRSLKDDELFVLWFMTCFVTDEARGLSSLVGGARDKSVDAIYIDDDARKVFVVQGKFRQKLNGPTEKRNDILGFAGLARSLTDDEAFRAYQEDLAAIAESKIAQARKRIKQQSYRLQLYFVTMGRCSLALAKEAQSAVRRASAASEIDIIDGKRVMRLLSDYLDGVAPPVPLLELELESGQGIKLTGILQRFDRKTKIESWVVPVAGDQIAAMYESAGIRLFARNVRGFLGDTVINRNMKETLDKEPSHFWYYNNGITVICDSAEQVSRSGRQLLRLVNPQIINGQQTSRTLHRCSERSANATVLVRVISVPRDSDDDSGRFENLVSRIVGATNWQNAIRPSDLMANDRRQVELERNLRKLDYQYLRKRQSKGEARRNAGMKHRFVIAKDELAQAVAACDLDPIVVREGKEQLFEESHYASIFPKSDPDYYLPRYWLGKHVAAEARGYPERAYAKWLVLHWMWKQLSRVLGTKARKECFRVNSERELSEKLLHAARAVFGGALAYYRANRGSGSKQLDTSQFFKRRNHHLEFEKHFSRGGNKHRARFVKAWHRYKEEFESRAAG